MKAVLPLNRLGSSGIESESTGGSRILLKGRGEGGVADCPHLTRYTVFACVRFPLSSP